MAGRWRFGLPDRVRGRDPAPPNRRSSLAGIRGAMVRLMVRRRTRRAWWLAGPTAPQPCRRMAAVLPAVGRARSRGAG